MREKGRKTRLRCGDASDVGGCRPRGLTRGTFDPSLDRFLYRGETLITINNDGQIGALENRSVGEFPRYVVSLS